MMGCNFGFLTLDSGSGESDLTGVSTESNVGARMKPVVHAAWTSRLLLRKAKLLS